MWVWNHSEDQEVCVGTEREATTFWQMSVIHSQLKSMKFRGLKHMPCGTPV